MKRNRTTKSFSEIFKKNLEKQYSRNSLRVMRFISVILLVTISMLVVFMVAFTPERMILGTWEYDYDESYGFYYGERVKMGSPLYPTLSFANETQMSTGEVYYINREELGIKAFWDSNYTTFKVESITPNKLVLWKGEPMTDMTFTYNVYRKK